MDTIYLNDFKENFEKYYEVENILYDDLNVVLYSNDLFLIECFIYINIKLKFNSVKTVNKTTFNGIEFGYNLQFVVFESSTIVSLFADFLSYLRTISNNKIMLDGKLYIFIKNIHILSKTQQQILASLMDSQKSTVIICTTNNFSKVIERIKSRNFCKRLPLNNLPYILKKYQNDYFVGDEETFKEIIKLDKNLYSSLLHLHTGMHLNIIENEFNQIIILIKRSKNIATYITKIREIMYKFIIYNVPHREISKSIYYSIYKKYRKTPSILHELINNVSELDHNICLSSKPLYHYELFFLKLYKIVNTN